MPSRALSYCRFEDYADQENFARAACETSASTCTTLPTAICWMPRTCAKSFGLGFGVEGPELPETPEPQGLESTSKAKEGLWLEALRHLASQSFSGLKCLV